MRVHGFLFLSYLPIFFLVFNFILCRFEAEFGEDAPTEHPNEEYCKIFEGNIDDCFRMGVRSCVFHFVFEKKVENRSLPNSQLKSHLNHT